MEPEETWSNEYSMDYKRRGLAVIINNSDFLVAGVGKRPGTDVDAARMGEVLDALGFDVIEYKNKTKKATRAILKQSAEYDHYNSDCFAFVVLSHGESGSIMATDGIIALSDLFEPFAENKCPGLRGKPKLFFIQACQGTKLDDGVDFVGGADTVDSPSGAEALLGDGIKVMPDFLVVTASPSGYSAWRNESRGSWFCQAFCEVVSCLGDRMDFLRLLTRVNKKVAYDFQSLSFNPKINAKKQIPCVMSMLTKDLYFREKAAVPECIE